MEVVGARFCHYIDDSAQHSAKLRLVVVRVHLEFLDIVDDRRHRVSTAEAFLVVKSVDKEKIAAVRLAVDRWEREGTDCVASKLLVPTVLRGVYRADTRCEVQQLSEVSAVEGQIVYRFAVDHRAQLGSGGLQSSLCRLHGHA